MAELQRMQHDPNFVLEFALGPPASTLVDQTGAPPELNLNFQNKVSREVTRYVLKSAHLSADDLRTFDVKTGKLAFVSHHPGKNPVRLPAASFPAPRRFVVLPGGRRQQLYLHVCHPRVLVLQLSLTFPLTVCSLVGLALLGNGLQFLTPPPTLFPRCSPLAFELAV